MNGLTAVLGRQVNVGTTERWASTAVGAALLVYGARRRHATGVGLAAAGAVLLYRGLSGHCPAYAAAGLDRATTDTKAALGGSRGMTIDERVTIARPASALYRYWRNFGNLPRFMRYLESVRPLAGGVRSHWVVQTPIGARLEWDAEIINDVEDELIGWRSLEGADVVHAGSVHFTQAPGGKETEVRVRFQYDPPGGKLGSSLARLLGRDPGALIREDLGRLKAMMEGA